MCRPVINPSSLQSAWNFPEDDVFKKGFAATRQKIMLSFSTCASTCHLRDMRGLAQVGRTGK